MFVVKVGVKYSMDAKIVSSNFHLSGAKRISSNDKCSSTPLNEWSHIVQCYTQQQNQGR